MIELKRPPMNFSNYSKIYQITSSRFKNIQSCKILIETQLKRSLSFVIYKYHLLFDLYSNALVISIYFLNNQFLLFEVLINVKILKKISLIHLIFV